MATNPQQCGLVGNSDLYGLGIRLGIYLQWITSQIAFYFHLEGSNDLSNADLIFSFALVIALFVLTFQHRTYTIEVVIINKMFFGGTLAVRGYQKKNAKIASSGWRSLLATFSVTGMAVYGACMLPVVTILTPGHVLLTPAADTDKTTY